MLSLPELQRGFRHALLGGDDRAIAAAIAGDGLTPGERIGIYRNNVMASLTAALKSTFPVVCRLVDERFFAYAAHEFIRLYPPDRPCLSEYGARFPAFLAEFPPCRDLVYIADVSRLEWMMHRAAQAAEETPLNPARLREVDPQTAPRLTFRLQASYAYLSSPWPVTRIWRANRPGAAGQAVDLDSGGVDAEIRRHQGDVELRVLPASLFSFRRALSTGRTLGEAIEAGLAEDQDFDVADALSGLIAEGALTGMLPDDGETR